MRRNYSLLYAVVYNIIILDYYVIIMTRCPQQRHRFSRTLIDDEADCNIYILCRLGICIHMTLLLYRLRQSVQCSGAYCVRTLAHIYISRRQYIYVYITCIEQAVNVRHGKVFNDLRGTFGNR